MKIYTTIIFCLFLFSCDGKRIEYIVNDREYSWYAVIYNVEDAKEIKIRDGTYVLDFTKNHVIETSSPPLLGKYKLNVVAVDKSGARKNLTGGSYSIYPSRYVEEIIENKLVCFHEFYFGEKDGSGDARSLVSEHLRDR